MGALPIRDRAVRAWGAALSVAIALHALGAVASSGPDDIGWQRCAETRVVVRAADRRDADDACQGARRPIDFFNRLELRADEPIIVEIVSELPDIVSPTAAGAFLKSEGRVLLQTYEKFRTNGTWFEVPVDRRLYQSAATHEIAHALALDNFRTPAPTIEAMEYIAYVTQFATMEESQRRQVLAAIPGDGFTDEVEMSTVIYMLAPMRFAAEAYRHYLKPGNGAVFLRAVLSGVALGD